jgi:hypothetical protein
MYSRVEDRPSENGKKVNQLSKQILALQTQIQTFKILLNDKDYIISQLKKENSQLKDQIQTIQQQASIVQPPNQYISQPKPPNQYIDPLKPPNQYISPTFTANTGTLTNKRKCPICGAMGFAIKEFDDKSRIISYVPRRIYARKRVCTKCKHEF